MKTPGHAPTPGCSFPSAQGSFPPPFRVQLNSKTFDIAYQLAKLSEELGVTVDYLVTEKESVIVDLVPAIKANRKLSLDVKKALINLVKELESH